MDRGSSRTMLSSVVTAHQLGGPLRLPHITERTELLDPRLDVEHRRPGHRIEPGDVDVQTVHRYEPAPRHSQSVGASPAALGEDPYRRLVLMSRDPAGTQIDVVLRLAVEEEDDFKVRKLPPGRAAPPDRTGNCPNESLRPHGPSHARATHPGRQRPRQWAMTRQPTPTVPTDPAQAQPPRVPHAHDRQKHEACHISRSPGPEAQQRAPEQTLTRGMNSHTALGNELSAHLDPRCPLTRVTR